MATTVLIEPDYFGHRYQAVSHVARLAGQDGDVVLLTTKGARERPEFSLIADLPIEVHECFDSILPPTRAMAAAAAEQCRTREVDTVMVMDADQSLKRWWYVAAREFRGLRRRPRVVFMLTRYPAQLRLTDWFGWKLRIAKASLALVAMGTRTLHHVAGFAGRQDLSRGWLVKRARDPAICSAHSRDRSAIRRELGLPGDRVLVGIFGVISDRKNAPFVLDAMESSGIEADLVLGGMLIESMPDWLAALPPERRRRVIVRDGFLSDETLDRLVAAMDVIALPLTLNGPSGIMGKALAAGVPVVSAGSLVRAEELRATSGGETAELTVPSFGAALKRVVTPGWRAAPGRSAAPPATAEAFAAVLLGSGARRADSPVR